MLCHTTCSSNAVITVQQVQTVFQLQNITAHTILVRNMLIVSGSTCVSFHFNCSLAWNVTDTGSVFTEARITDALDHTQDNARPVRRSLNALRYGFGLPQLHGRRRARRNVTLRLTCWSSHNSLFAHSDKWKGSTPAALRCWSGFVAPAGEWRRMVGSGSCCLCHRHGWALHSAAV